MRDLMLLAVTELQQTAIAKNYVQNMHYFSKNRIGITSLGFSSDLEIFFSFLFPPFAGMTTFPHLEKKLFSFVLISILFEPLEKCLGLL